MMKKLVKIASTIMPGVMAKIAYRQLTNPQTKKIRPNEAKKLDEAKQEDFSFQNFNIKLYIWGNGPKKVLMVHGWEGHAGNFSDIITELVNVGYTVYGFDAPSHGKSSSGQTNLFDFSELVAVLIKKFSVNKVISHSFGGVATTYGLFTNKHLKLSKYVSLTTPDRLQERVDSVSIELGITQKVVHRIITLFESETGLSYNDLNVSTFASETNVDEALIIHDKNDRVIPLKQSKNVHESWPNSRLLVVEGTGHFRILRTKFVAEHIINFLEA